MKMLNTITLLALFILSCSSSLQKAYRNDTVKTVPVSTDTIGILPTVQTSFAFIQSSSRVLAGGLFPMEGSETGVQVVKWLTDEQQLVVDSLFQQEFNAFLSNAKSIPRSPNVVSIIERIRSAAATKQTDDLTLCDSVRSLLDSLRISTHLRYLLLPMTVKATGKKVIVDNAGTSHATGMPINTFPYHETQTFTVKIYCQLYDVEQKKVVLACVSTGEERGSKYSQIITREVLCDVLQPEVRRNASAMARRAGWPLSGGGKLRSIAESLRPSD